MLQLNAKSLVTAIARNQAHRLLGGAVRGGHRQREWNPAKRNGHVDYAFDSLAPHLDPLDGCLAVEIGPGDHLGLARRLIEAGCREVIAVEKYAQPGRLGDSDPHIEFVACPVEEFDPPEPVDVIVSNDVLEHVDVAATMRHCFAVLRPGGQFVSSVDLRGHNTFNKPDRPLDFLTCPDWLYGLMHSHIETSNRVRRSDLVRAAEEAGFAVEAVEPIEAIGTDYVRAVRPHLLPRYRELAEDDLSTAQVVIALRKPAAVNKPR